MTAVDLNDVIADWERTCYACPTQYDIHLKDGRYVYFRFRHGVWRMELYSSQRAFGDGSAWVIGKAVSDELDGFMSHDEVWRLLELELPRLLEEVDRA